MIIIAFFKFLGRVISVSPRYANSELYFLLDITQGAALMGLWLDLRENEFEQMVDTSRSNELPLEKTRFE